jgi:hypothetical protein
MKNWWLRAEAASILITGSSLSISPISSLAEIGTFAHTLDEKLKSLFLIQS